MSLSDIAAWIAVALVPCTAIVGWALRRWGRGTFVKRLRPHFILGYAALFFAVMHVGMSMGNTDGVNGMGIWFAGFATAGLALQAIVGSNLQSPGIYRWPLRRWHIALFIAIVAFGFGHIALNAPFLPIQM